MSAAAPDAHLGRTLILASTSPYRRALMQRLGVPFRAEAPRLDEEAFKRTQPGHDPQRLAEALARAKSLSLTKLEPDAVVIGSDQLVTLDGRIWGKPGTVAQAVEQLNALSGRTHELITAMALAHDGRVEIHTDVTRLTMRTLSATEVARYVAADRPFDCAGAYKLEARGITLFESIVSDDHTAITGLPLIALTSLLRTLGFRIP